AQALQTIERARRLLPATHAALERFQREVEQKAGSFPALLGRLHEAANQARWRDVIDLSEQVLAAAPQHAEARKARARACKAIEPVTGAEKSTIQPAPAENASSPRFLLWIDGVGGFLVCLAPKVTMGQATPEGNVDLPLFADISRVHATLTRDVEGYLL